LFWVIIWSKIFSQIALSFVFDLLIVAKTVFPSGIAINLFALAFYGYITVSEKKGMGANISC
jgi:hypothetical protein